MNLYFKRYLTTWLIGLIGFLFIVFFTKAGGDTGVLFSLILTVTLVFLNLFFVKSKSFSPDYSQLAKEYALSYVSDGSTASNLDAERSYLEQWDKSGLYQFSVSDSISGTIHGVDIEFVNLTAKMIPLTISPVEFVAKRRLWTRRTTRLRIGGVTKYIFESNEGFASLLYYGNGYASVTTISKIFQELAEQGVSTTFNDSYGSYPISRKGFLVLNYIYFYEGSRENPSPRLVEKMNTPHSAKERKGRLILVVCLIFLFLAAAIISANI